MTRITTRCPRIETNGSERRSRNTPTRRCRSTHTHLNNLQTNQTFTRTTQWGAINCFQIELRTFTPNTNTSSGFSRIFKAISVDTQLMSTSQRMVRLPNCPSTVRRTCLWSQPSVKHTNRQRFIGYDTYIPYLIPFFVFAHSLCSRVCLRRLDALVSQQRQTRERGLPVSVKQNKSTNKERK